MVPLNVIRIPVGYANSFLILNGRRSLLIDTGIRKHATYILQTLKKCKLEPSDLALIIQTHTHFDHAGNTAELKQQTGARVLVHEKEAACLARGYTRIPDGTNLLTRNIASLGRKVYPSLAAYPAVGPDIVISGKYSLAEWGIDGYILPTPGHTDGSVSVILENRLIITGDCFFPVYPHTVFPPFGNDVPLLLKTWKLILDLHISEMYAGHGPKFTRERVLKCYREKCAGRSTAN
ncbi:MAG: MBL fold metallo-hydrolase [Prolixibacteraceae bacterium]|nr:MBL fold metallo-hydrolase [Prolixibacteraceae bacterium]